MPLSVFCQNSWGCGQIAPEYFFILVLLIWIFLAFNLNILKNELKIHKFKIWDKIMHVIKVAQLLFRRVHFAVELAEVYISYSGEYFRVGIQGSKCTKFTSSIRCYFIALLLVSCFFSTPQAQYCAWGVLKKHETKSSTIK